MSGGPVRSKVDEIGASGRLVLRVAEAGDQEFLFRVYSSTREEEVASFGWGPAQKEAFLRMQYDARRRSYAAANPGAAVSVIVDSVAAIGSMIVHRVEGEIRLVDISVISEHRGRGVGTQLISGLKLECERSRVPLRLSVLRGNRAIHLYERLGFKVTQDDPMYVEMEYLPAPASMQNEKN